MIIELIRFKKVADLGSITKAAEILWITQPALTQSIQRLEQELEIKLFRPSGKRIALTEEGKIAYEIAQKIISLWEKAKSIKDPNSFPSTISVGVFDNAALQLSSYLQQKAKEAKIEIVIDRSDSLLKKLQYGLLDICVCVLPKDPALYSNLSLVKTYEEKLLPVSATTRKESRNTLPFIAYNTDSQTYGYINNAFVRAGIQPNNVAEAINPLFMKELAMQNVGVALLPENMVKKDIEDKRLVIQRLPISFTRTCGIFQSKNSTRKEIYTILQELLEVLSN